MSRKSLAAQAVTLLATVCATKNSTPEEIEEARRAVNAAKLEDAIRATADAMPPLTDAQRERLALLLSPGRSS
jgi:hypothetical protein